ncbi:MAG: hypothetical protein LBI86_11690 [Treponema sp.]|nr:hypothetical protein [Treponema sp.]
MHQKQAVTREYLSRYQKAAKKAKSALLDEFTRLTGCRRKSAVRLLSGKPVREILACRNGEAVKLKPEKKRPANRKGKRFYTNEVIASLRLVRVFFRYKCGRTKGPQIPAAIDRYLKKDKEALRLKGKSLTKPLHSLKSRIPTHLLLKRGAEKTRFPANRHGSPLRAGHSGPVYPYPDRYRGIIFFTAPGNIKRDDDLF